MNDLKIKEYERRMKSRPHVVIVGAGASCAAIPKGDKHGKYISAMSGFIKKMGLDSILSRVSIHTRSDNLEDIYMELDERSTSEVECLNVKNDLEHAIHEYISGYELPDNPTDYDFLVLSLTSKDLIATFNWDPFLLQAYERASRLTRNLPQLAFLHGNVAVGYCTYDNVLGWNGRYCRCGRKLSSVNLLYPVKNKNYTSDDFIQKEWQRLQYAMETAYMLTIFGYSAPVSDVAAIAMLKDAWGNVSNRNMEEIELVDIRNEEDVVASWENFIHTHHYSYHTSILETTLGKFPRRSCEATFDRLMNVRWLKPNGFKKDMTFSDIERFLDPLFDDESENEGKMLSNPYL